MHKCHWQLPNCHATSLSGCTVYTSGKWTKLPQHIPCFPVIWQAKHLLSVNKLTFFFAACTLAVSDFLLLPIFCKILTICVVYLILLNTNDNYVKLLLAKFRSEPVVKLQQAYIKQRLSCTILHVQNLVCKIFQPTFTPNFQVILQTVVPYYKTRKTCTEYT